jgi:hypothetical protein
MTNIQNVSGILCYDHNGCLNLFICIYMCDGVYFLIIKKMKYYLVFLILIFIPKVNCEI